MGDDYSFDVKTIEIWVPTFFKHNNSSVATVIGRGEKVDTVSIIGFTQVNLI